MRFNTYPSNPFPPSTDRMDVDVLETEVSQLKIGLTNLDNEVNGDATTYPYADVITINDAVPANLADCKVKIEPVQDLHGYDKPWVGGAGKNKLPMTVDSIKALNTTGTWNGNIYTHRSATVEVLTDNADNVLGFNVNGTPTGGKLWFRLVPNTFDIESNTILNGCPSGGWYNTYCIAILDSGDAETLYSDTGSSGVTINNSAENVNVYIRIEEGYTASNLMFYPMIRLATETVATFAPYTNLCPISGHTEASVTVADDTESPTVTKTYTLALGDTIYGGTVDFDSGVMTVDRGNIASYAGETLPGAWISSMDVYTEGGTPTAGAQVVYELATPTTIQLTPQQIHLLQGTNTLYASTGDISVTVNGVSGAIGAMQTAVNELAEQLPSAPTTDGTYTLAVTVADGTPAYSWVSGS